MPMHRWRCLALLPLIATVALAEPPSPSYRWSGSTMGSTYAVEVVDPRVLADTTAIGLGIDAILASADREMSTWRDDSEISRFNAWTATSPFAVSPALSVVVRNALDVSRRSGGAFDITFSPLFDLWGFGRHGATRLPAPADIDATRARCGWTNLEVTDDGSLVKHIPGLEVTLNAIGPGATADRIAFFLEAQGISNLYVDIGGESVARGVNAKGEPWRIGIERPTDEGDPLVRIVPLSNQAIATSGDYRNFVTDENGGTFSHIFDARIGRPATSRVASVTIVAPSATLADALSTTLFAMGPEEGIPWLTNYPGAAAFFVLHNATGGFTEVTSPGFPDSM